MKIVTDTPYREVPEQDDKKPVPICKNCVYYYGNDMVHDGSYHHTCIYNATWRTDCITGKKSLATFFKCKVRNKDLDCEFFEKKPPSWWKKWLGIDGN